MISPARRHRIRHEVAAAKADEADQLRPDLTQYELHLAQLAEHKRRLKQLQSIERKIEAKRKMLPEYMDYIAGVLAAPGADGAADDVLTTIMVWLIDTGCTSDALDVAEYVLAHKVPLPDHYDRTPATLVTEEVAEHALQALAAGAEDAPARPVAEYLGRLASMVADHDMPDQVRAKLHKALGYALRDAQPADALTHLQRALELNAKAGVKKAIERLQRSIKNNPQQSSPSPAANTAGAAGTPSQSGDTAD